MGGTTGSKLVRLSSARRRLARRKIHALAPAQPLPESMALAAIGLGQAGFTAGEKEALGAPFRDEQYDILPSGIAYVSHVHIRRRLADVFGPGDWALMGKGEPQMQGTSVMRHWVLLVRGRPVGEAHGEARYVSSNRQSSQGKALEGAKSNALTRICKDLMPLEPWDRRWQFQFRLRHGVLVSVRGRGGVEQQWRHVDSPPLTGEFGVCDDSPNQDRYLAPTAARKRAAVGYSETASDEDARQAHETRAEAMVAYLDTPLTLPARQSLFGAMRAHHITEVEFRDFIKAEWGYGSTKQILASQHARALEWIKHPDETSSGQALEGEVVS